MTDIGLEPCSHFFEYGAERLDGDFPLSVQELNKSRHVRALEVVRQIHVHVECRDRVLLARGAILYTHWVIDVLDADAIDRQEARIGAPLNVFNVVLRVLGLGGNVIH